MIKAEVVMARCSKTKETYGVRVEQREKDWIRTWAFPIDERKAKHEGYDTNTISGSMTPTSDFPGCPYCKSMAVVICSCKKMSCGNTNEKTHTCPWCGNSGKLEVVESINVSGGGY